LVAAILRTGVGVFTDNNSRHAFPCLPIAVLVGAIQSIITTLGDEVAFARIGVACIGCTRITVATLFGWIFTRAALCVAIIDRAVVSVVACQCRAGTTGGRIADIRRTGISVITIHGRAATVSGDGITGIVGTRITIFTCD